MGSHSDLIHGGSGKIAHLAHRKDPPSPESSTLVATPPPVDRETNIMTQDELDRLRESHSSPPNVQIRLPEEDETIAFTRPGEVAFYESTFYVGGTPTTSSDGRRNSSLSQEMTESSLREFPRMLVFQGFRGNRAPQVSAINKPPILSTNEQESLDGILDSLLGENFFKIKEVLESKSFRRCSKLGSKLMVSSGGDNGEDIPTVSVAPVAGDEGESHHSRDEPRRDDHSQDSSIEYIKTGSSSSNSEAWSDPWPLTELRLDGCHYGEALAKKKAIEEFKSSDDFQGVAELTASKYFGKGFDFGKRQLNCLHPDLDIQDMGIDTNLLEEEEEKDKEKEEEKEGEKKEERRRAIRTAPSLLKHLYSFF
ncbi:hypothetical protein Acr_00g0075100 [Actinidia rufa]|uniref:Uncharacterized protein n=1 Tax=Actinidia rufa TaxID=165716 RepID=A0A7J0DSK7_9ERIC|nr:hypothetical protein Acr_00g0075100 [Actinidia rufa]